MPSVAGFHMWEADMGVELGVWKAYLGAAIVTGKARKRIRQGGRPRRPDKARAAQKELQGKDSP